MPTRFALFFLLAIVIGFSSFGSSVMAADPPDDPPEGNDIENADYDKGKAAVRDGKYKLAIESLKRTVLAIPEHTNALNYIGYSYRKMGNFKESLAYYKEALAIDSEHRAALEYLGELYLQTGDLKSAKAQLKKLDSACTFGCEEFDKLKEAIATFTTKGKG